MDGDNAGNTSFGWYRLKLLETSFQHMKQGCLLSDHGSKDYSKICLCLFPVPSGHCELQPSNAWQLSPKKQKTSPNTKLQNNEIQPYLWGSQ